MNRLRMCFLLFVFSLLGLNGVVSNLYGQTAEKSGSNSTEFRAQLSEALQVYFDLEKAIFEGDTKIASAEASLLLKTVSDVDSRSLKEDKVADWQKLNQELKDSAEKLSSVEDISEQRGAFLDISNAFIDLVKNYGPLNKDAYLYHCPMAMKIGGHWLSPSRDVSNPYLGGEMATCGTLVESFELQN